MALSNAERQRRFDQRRKQRNVHNVTAEHNATEATDADMRASTKPAFGFLDRMATEAELQHAARVAEIKAADVPHCSFCDRAHGEVDDLFGGLAGRAFICNHCITNYFEKLKTKYGPARE
jgi:hypothetical protein